MERIKAVKGLIFTETARMERIKAVKGLDLAVLPVLTRWSLKTATTCRRVG
ncbi:hypothetical protein M3223_14380 [Paenibacillus pasadenensis]|uniref:hypothetical protein n=1 Tax=Paenibacillus pasadenensis TaxID=217090 RepID=UPI0020412A60|nr:hypothetical protein [Paenibacillus pasadenensis]MCM3748535.1 hypothetical protein [Paenibacillus pasadenensis]